ncbi:MAG: gamma-glutamyl-gamma-aminobutyrate hydrolase family protein [Lentisphaeria bacterium]|nr:gamma-glutamyl-gamma-aminobutyrate hydrolase family protein [Lentisphaeria bacterium]
MDKPLIGITTYGRDVAGRCSLPVEYIECVRRAAGAVVLLPPGDTDIVDCLQRLDGLILAGGGDIDPALYGGEDHDTVYMTDIDRDRDEIAMVRRAVDADVPLFGICRGMQIVNVALGGSLHSHLPDIIDELDHRVANPAAAPDDPNPTTFTPHLVSIAPGSKLSALLGVTECEIASWHHQAVRQVPESLQVVATAADGTVEAVESCDHRLFAVQWHPEITAAADPVQQRLFDRFVAGL